jgi:hypothetical protein
VVAPGLTVARIRSGQSDMGDLDDWQRSDRKITELMRAPGRCV